MTTHAQRVNARQDKVWELAMRARNQVALFSAEWERTQGYKPATFQKAIAMQRLERGQTIAQIIESFVAARV